MSDYVYSPQDKENAVSGNGKSSTSIRDLEDLEYIDYNNQSHPSKEFGTRDVSQRMDPYNDLKQVISNDQFPDLTSTPIYQQTVPISDVNNSLTNQRTRVMSVQENIKNAVDHNSNKLENISFKDFFSKVSESYIEIIDDLLDGNWVIETFTKDNRLLAMGILFVIISIFFIFFNQIE